MTRQESPYRWVVFFTALAAYYLIVSQRTAPGLVTNSWMSEFHISAGALGLMDSVQFLAYALLQVPVGLLADRFGPNRFLIFGTLTNALGTLLTGVATHAWVLFVARFLVGVGDATIFVNLVAVINLWFRAQEFVALLGIIGVAAGLGSLTATVPYALWIHAWGWRSLFVGVSLILFGLCGALYVVLVQRPKRMFEGDVKRAGEPVRPASVREAIRQTFTSRQAYALAMCHFGLVGTYVGFMGSWGVAYFMQVFHMARSAASAIVMLGLVGAMVGGPLTSWLASRFGQVKRLYTFVHAVTFLSWLVWFASGMRPWFGLVPVLLALIGFGNGGSSLTFAIVRQTFPVERVGVVSGFANMGGFVSAVLLPSLFGVVLDQFPGDRALGFHFGLLIPVLFTAVGVTGALLARDVKRPAAIPVQETV
ncbi:MFS transporter [Alicyclobacillus acidocaldarius]|uniref:Major facilitator superfamily MFS_1 n=1 Tax=Alicyclobacillus acidocaldarius subsp. acidocaldarius (strain ATCC 27009 / DSM 446 / BCRC 14685 / JCM 5260 / KCTC 1825 / NBRC 15652 / NCIMB 11725 / NRRL B-14509 / 104-IA) TaxID=521098 RepID=C8WTS7_ALIAD|nr:MFS transporter [Alicyclobacillus acidocaldarius]ACV59669.1 major facilitator superfamily MFS_1 [Alicyclobacillus acidocaldarius subsp. acidocaldarius DSM 446]